MSEYLPKLDKIDNLVADDVWAYTLKDRSRRLSRVTVGRPCPIPGDPSGDWYCPLFIEHKLTGVELVVGVGPVDALMNAMKAVYGFTREIFKLAPRALQVKEP